MSEIVFILGAGASKEAGAPLMADFLDKARKVYADGKAVGFKEDFERVFDAISKLQIIHSKSQLDIYNIESVFAIFEMARIIRSLPGIPNNKIKSILNSLKKLIAITLERTVSFPVFNNEILPTESYSPFISLVNNLNKNGKIKRCSIITFNYDLALDYSFALKAYRGEINVYPDYCIPKGEKNELVPLIKLHGSLNWFKCSNCKKLFCVDLHSFISKRPDIRGFTDRNFSRVSIKSNFFDSDNICEYCKEKIVESETFIVPPTWNKTEYNKEIAEVWINAAKELSEAENIFVIGYSLPESDYFFRYLYGLGTVSNHLIKRFWVFDPDQTGKVRNRFEEMLGDGVKERFRFFDKTFYEAIKILWEEFTEDRESSFTGFTII